MAVHQVQEEGNPDRQVTVSVDHTSDDDVMAYAPVSKQMILPRDLQIASTLAVYMKNAGYAATLHTDCLTFAHVLRRTNDDITIDTTLKVASKLLDAVFMLGLRQDAQVQETLTDSDMRLYMRVFVSSRLPPVVTLWNATGTATDQRLLPRDADTGYDVVNAENAAMGEVYMAFRNKAGIMEDYLGTPTDTLKSLVYRRTPEVKTFANSVADRLIRVVYASDAGAFMSESNTQPLKVYQPSEIDDECLKFLRGAYVFTGESYAQRRSPIVRR